MAEDTTATMTVIDFSVIVKVLGPLIRTSSYPTILGAIKMLTKLIEMQPNKVMDDHLKLIVPGLITVKKLKNIPIGNVQLRFFFPGERSRGKSRTKKCGILHGRHSQSCRRRKTSTAHKTING